MNKIQLNFMSAKRGLDMARQKAAQKEARLKLRKPLLLAGDKETIAQEVDLLFYLSRFQAARRALFAWGKELVRETAPEAGDVLMWFNLVEKDLNGKHEKFAGELAELLLKTQEPTGDELRGSLIIKKPVRLI